MGAFENSYGVPTNIVTEETLTPLTFELKQNYPNPFNPSTVIKYSIPSFVISNPQRGERSPNSNIMDIPNHTSTSSVSVRDDKSIVTLSSLPASGVGAEESFVTLKVYDILGREVTTLVNQKQKPGYYEVSWDAGNNSSGIYFYKMNTGKYIETKKMILLR